MRIKSKPNIFENSIILETMYGKYKNNKTLHSTIFFQKHNSIEKY